MKSDAIIESAQKDRNGNIRQQRKGIIPRLEAQ
jgi:hypothetical protein